MHRHIGRLAFPVAILALSCVYDSSSSPPAVPSESAKSGQASRVPAIIDLGTLGGSLARGEDINDNGQVVGFGTSPADQANHVFLWGPAHGMTDLGTLGSRGAMGLAVNNHGQIVGNGGRPFFWSPDSGVTILGGIQAFDLNDAGTVVGVASRYGFRWSKDTGMRRLLPLLDGTYSAAWAINASGDAVGYSNVGARGRDRVAVMWPAGSDRPIRLGKLPTSNITIAMDINSAGDVVGYSKVGERNNHAFLWTTTSGMVDLGTLPGGGWSEAYGINDAGEVVGASGTAAGGSRAFLWRPGTGMIDLGSLSASLPWSQATAINNSGQISGWSYSFTPGFPEHAVLWQ